MAHAVEVLSETDDIRIAAQLLLCRASITTEHFGLLKRSYDWRSAFFKNWFPKIESDLVVLLRRTQQAPLTAAPAPRSRQHY